MKRSWIICIGLALAACLVTTAPAGGIHPELGARLRSLGPEEEVSVIVTLTDQVDLHQFKDKDKKVRRTNINRALRAKADKTQGPLNQFLRDRNVRKIKPFWIFNGMAVTLRSAQVEELAGRPEVRSVRLDSILSLPSPSPSQAGTPEWNLNAINVPALWELGYTGTGIVVATMDTGVDSLHPDIGPKWRGGTNSWYDPHGEHPDTPYDNDGHGTRGMGIMVGGDAGGTSIGVAPGAQWVAVKLFDDAGEAQYSDIHSGFQWLLDPDDNPDTDDAPDVVNNSWGFDTAVDQCLPEFQSDVQALKTAGVAVVFAAGNTGPNDFTSISPANYPESFGVGSVDQRLEISNFSARGPSACDDTVFPEIVAPGENILTADLTSGGTFPDSYAYVQGTSFAAPHVAGSMALLLSADPELAVDQLEELLKNSAADLGEPGPDNIYGYGLLDAAAAVHNLLNIHSFAVSITGSGQGSVTSDPPGINCPGDCEQIFFDGTVVTLSALPQQGSTFAGWSGDCSGQEITCEVTVDRGMNVTADFYSFPWELFVPGISGQAGR